MCDGHAGSRQSRPGAVFRSRPLRPRSQRAGYDRVRTRAALLPGSGAGALGGAGDAGRAADTLSALRVAGGPDRVEAHAHRAWSVVHVDAVCPGVGKMLVLVSGSGHSYRFFDEGPKTKAVLRP